VQVLSVQVIIMHRNLPTSSFVYIWCENCLFLQWIFLVLPASKILTVPGFNWYIKHTFLNKTHTRLFFVFPKSSDGVSRIKSKLSIFEHAILIKDILYNTLSLSVSSSRCYWLQGNRENYSIPQSFYELDFFFFFIE